MECYRSKTIFALQRLVLSDVAGVVLLIFVGVRTPLNMTAGRATKLEVWLKALYGSKMIRSEFASLPVSEAFWVLCIRWGAVFGEVTIRDSI